MRSWILERKEVVSAFAFSFALIVVGWLMAYLELRAIEEPLILHFSNYTGINQIGGVANLAVLGGLGFIFWAINSGLALALENRLPFLGRVVSTATLLVAILLFMAFMAIISANT